MACLAIFGSNGATGAEPDAGEAAPPHVGTWQQQIADLEAKLFDPILSVGEVDRLLGELEHAETRAEAARRLAEQGQGHVDRVIAFARHCPDMEARQACVEIVEALDASYRTTALGEQLGRLYREHAEALLPAYWARFRNDPLDLRAVAMLMHADADATYAALGRTGDRHDPLRYLLLRIRELSPDEFARKHVFEHTASGAQLVMSNVLPPRFVSAASPQVAASADGFSDMAVRRRQAEAELRAARAIVRDDPHGRDEQKVLARVEHTEAALKLDPTFNEAAYEHLTALACMCRRSFSTSPPDRIDELAERTLNHAVQCLGQFGAEAAGRGEIHTTCQTALHASLGRPSLSECLRWTPQRLRMVQHARYILEESIRRDDFSRHLDCHTMTPTFVVRGMRHAGVPLDERDRWIDWVLKEFGRHEPAVPRADDPRDRTRSALHWLWLRAAELAVEDGNFQRAGKLIAELKYRIASGFKPSHEPVLPRIHDLLVMMDDAEALAAFDRWVKELEGSTVERLDIEWPSIVVFRDEQRTGPYVTCTMPPVEGIRFRHPPLLPNRYHTAISALVEGDGRLYVVLSGTDPIRWEHFQATAFGVVSQIVGYIALDDAGRPTRRVGRAGNEVPASVLLLPQPDVDELLHVLDAKHMAGRLFLGTLKNGLLVFDVEAGTWSAFTSEHGLPAQTVLAIHPLDERTLFCVGQLNDREPLCYTFELPKGTVTLLHRALPKRPTACWRDGDELRAWSGNGLYENLRGPAMTHNPRHGSLPYGWSDFGAVASPSIALFSIVEVGGRWFGTRDGLHEFDAKGTILRSWWGSNQVEGDFGRAFNVSLPPDCPIQGNRIVAAGDLLVFHHRASILAWSPETDTWYGPLAVAGAVHAMGTRAGVWLGTEDGVVFVSIDELLRTARHAGRAMTTDQYRRLQREIVAAMPPLDRAKMAFSMRQFDTAKELAEAVLDTDPECVEALLLMGYLHDLWCTKRPEVALEYYKRLVELKADRNASFTGLYQRFVLLRTQKRWPETLATIDEIIGQFPRLREREQGNIDWWRKHAREQLDAPDANQHRAGNGSDR